VCESRPLVFDSTMLRPTRFSVPFIIVLVVFTAAWLTSPASAVNEPSPITHLVTATNPYTSQERGQIRAWAEWWMTELASGEPDRVSQARRRLSEPLRAANVRILFREAYSEAMVAEVESKFDEGIELYPAVNALQVAALLGTESAARMLTTRANPADEPRRQVRLWAVHGIKSIFQQGELDAGRFPGVLRELSRAASRETDWIVLQRHFEAFRAADTENARSRQLALLDEIIDRMEDKDEPDEVIRAVHAAVVVLRHQFANLRSAEQRSFGTEAAPTIGRVFNLASRHWNGIEDSNLAEAYGGAVQVSEALLANIDALVRGQNATPQTNIARAWTDRNRQNFDQGANRWAEVLRNPPYRDRR